MILVELGWVLVCLVYGRRVLVLVGLRRVPRGPVLTGKVSRTIADLDDKIDISPEHVSEAIQYRTFDRTLWV